MSDVLVAATALSLLFAVLMTIIAAKLLRESRTRTSSRVEALQALAAEPAPVEPHSLAAAIQPALTGTAPTLPRPAAFAAPMAQPDDEWDFALHDEPQTLPTPAPRRRAQPIPDVLPVRVETPVRHAAISEHDLFEAAIPPTPSRRWTSVAAVAFLMMLGIGTFYLISSGVITRALARHEANVTNATALPIELLSLRYATGDGNFVVTGLVQNPATGASLRGVFAIVYLFDAEGKFVASARASLETGVLSPGGESSFVVRVPASGEVTKYRVSFQHEDGAAVQHVDRRGALPANTTGDVVQPPAAAPVITARKNG